MWDSGIRYGLSLEATSRVHMTVNGPGAGRFTRHAGLAIGCQLRLRRSVPTWVSFHRQAGSCLHVTSATMYLGMFLPPNTDDKLMRLRYGGPRQEIKTNKDEAKCHGILLEVLSAWYQSLRLKAVRRALGAKSKLGFITGACRKPTGDPELIEQWTRVDCMVASWLLNTMTKNISNAFIYAKSARTLWIDLEQRYGQRNGPLLYQLEREIASVSQGDLSVVDYFTKIQMLWDELVQVRPIPECTCGCTYTCGVAKATVDLAEQRQLMQFLMGLNHEYDTVRSQILVNEPLPSVNVAYSMVLRVEKQRQVHLAEPHEGAAMHAVTYDKKKELNSFRRRGVGDKRNLKCVHCDRTGHDKSTCFKLHGVSEWYKELNDHKRKGNTGTKAYAVQGTSQKDTKKEETISVSDVVMEFMRVLKHIPNDPIKVNCVDEYAGTDFTFSGTEHLTEQRVICVAILMLFIICILQPPFLLFFSQMVPLNKSLNQGL
ncbi:hypothetical protein Sango_0815400 [Sesamum angolense]|uniref:Retrotransposon gag domain-containing protein n=1 Tax=Sesamum angolense TaxID=2727404 RepID=A0AAE1X382_9LAMI|nr:hypothetical protein Sango_0815400 [Sesamum angolense]